MPGNFFVITETLYLVSDSALKVVFLSTLYADVKEPAPARCRPGREVLIAGIFFVPAFKTRNRSFLLLILLPGSQPGGGPDWTRTSDPALIKRML